MLSSPTTTGGGARRGDADDAFNALVSAPTGRIGTAVPAAHHAAATAAAASSIPAPQHTANNGNEETSWRNFLCRSTHPVAATFHLLFKVAALAVYLFGGWAGLGYVSIFILCVLALAGDFWTTKNITGRLLVGLRWWVNVRDDGTNEWFFESAPGLAVPPLDRSIFWWGLYAAPAAWTALAALAFVSLKLDWLVVDVVAVGLSSANLVGYFKCSTDAQRRLRASLASGAMTGLSLIPGALPAIGTTMLSILGAGGGSSSGSGAAAASAAAAPAPAPTTTSGDRGAKRNPFGGRGGAADANPFGDDDDDTV